MALHIDSGYNLQITNKCVSSTWFTALPLPALCRVWSEKLYKVGHQPCLPFSELFELFFINSKCLEQNSISYVDVSFLNWII